MGEEGQCLYFCIISGEYIHKGRWAQFIWRMTMNAQRFSKTRLKATTYVWNVDYLEPFYFFSLSTGTFILTYIMAGIDPAASQFLNLQEESRLPVKVD
jgi:hypothetical protein